MSPVEDRRGSRMQPATFELLGVRRRAPHTGWEFMWRTGIAGEDVIGKEVGRSSRKREVRRSALCLLVGKRSRENVTSGG